MSDFESVNKIKKLANKLFSCNLSKTKYKYDPFDLIDTVYKIVIEVKERHSLSNKFDTTIIGYNKYLKGLDYYKKGWKVFYFFIYDDGIFYYDYKGETYEPKKGGIWYKSEKEIQNYIYINIKDLIKYDGDIQPI